MYMQERVLVVGANGFIGTHLVNELIANKIPVTALLKNNASTNKKRQAPGEAPHKCTRC